MNKNREIAQIFETIADMLEVLEENRFKIRAYRNAARNIMELGDKIEEVEGRGELQSISGVGADLSRKISRYLETGKIEEYERLKERVPPGAVELLSIQGLGPKTLAMLIKKLGVRGLSDLEKVLDGEEIKKLPRMGQNKIEEMRRGIQIVKEGGERIPLGAALPTALEITSLVREMPGTLDAVITGSIRRMKENNKDIDILALTRDGGSVIKAFVELPIVREVHAQGETTGSIITGEGVKVNLRVAGPDSWGGALQYFTGSQAHNVKLRILALSKGCNLNEYGVFRGENRIAWKSEEEFYEALGLEWIPPELREDRGEIEAAAKGEIPDLIQLADIRGDLHTHSTWSDGRYGIEQMAAAARDMGYEYIAVTDHSPSSRIANGLSTERLMEKKKDIQRARKRVTGISILFGAEVDIKSDGSLDYPDDVLKELDVVIAAVHSGFNMERAAMTARITAALKNPCVHALAHPTGRLIGTRAPYEMDIDEVINTALKHGKALEVNSQYLRLDLNDINTKQAVDKGVKIIISTDAHHTNQLKLMGLGVGTARRGWLQTKNVINALGINELKRWLKTPGKLSA